MASGMQNSNTVTQSSNPQQMGITHSPPGTEYFIQNNILKNFYMLSKDISREGI